MEERKKRVVLIVDDYAGLERRMLAALEAKLRAEDMTVLVNGDPWPGGTTTGRYHGRIVLNPMPDGYWHHGRTKLQYDLMETVEPKITLGPEPNAPKDAAELRRRNILGKRKGRW